MRKLITLGGTFLCVTSLASAQTAAAPASWHAQSLGTAIGYTALFSLLGVFLAIVGYRVFDLCTPGNLHEEIIKNRNVAAAIVAGAVILGVCVIIGAAMLG